ncbi:predicted protein [Thalassiosira pseudonana CCMP1335]|uniref:Uncharacterized protein n=1 Tax=Thalassiosira pseudonana TaxID=35128 RepID=B8C7K4_THAPS|nr:predicted protein [Thalassiosira pseudonana CCMP1335]EED90760.1 predicted protein [Thalassiosira pseudonana CCMP1335]|eukprot:scaffold14820_cov428-Alexandrium_tamarense.AAC.5
MAFSTRQRHTHVVSSVPTSRGRRGSAAGDRIAFANNGRHKTNQRTSCSPEVSCPLATLFMSQNSGTSVSTSVDVQTPPSPPSEEDDGGDFFLNASRQAAQRRFEMLQGGSLAALLSEDDETKRSGDNDVGDDKTEMGDVVMLGDGMGENKPEDEQGGGKDGDDMTSATLPREKSESESDDEQQLPTEVKEADIQSDVEEKTAATEPIGLEEDIYQDLLSSVMESTAPTPSLSLANEAEVETVSTTSSKRAASSYNFQRSLMEARFSMQSKEGAGADDVPAKDDVQSTVVLPTVIDATIDSKGVDKLAPLGASEMAETKEGDDVAVTSAIDTTSTETAMESITEESVQSEPTSSPSEKEEEGMDKTNSKHYTETASTDVPPQTSEVPNTSTVPSPPISTETTKSAPVSTAAESTEIREENVAIGLLVMTQSMMALKQILDKKGK